MAERDWNSGMADPVCVTSYSARLSQKIYLTDRFSDCLAICGTLGTQIRGGHCQGGRKRESLVLEGFLLVTLW